jgi:hypothetical protein
LRKILAAAAGALLCLAPLGATPAMASTHPGADPETLYFTLYYNYGSALTSACERNTTYTIAQDNPDKAANACNVRVWMYQTKDPSKASYSLCISPHTTTTGNFQRVYRSFKMTNNTDPC